jgi:hypothetical protein
LVRREPSASAVTGSYRARRPCPRPCRGVGDHVALERLAELLAPRLGRREVGLQLGDVVGELGHRLAVVLLDSRDAALEPRGVVREGVGTASTSLVRPPTRSRLPSYTPTTINFTTI